MGVMKDTIIELDNVCFSYQEKPVLENVSLDIKSGSFLAVIGPNGAGKTTMLKLILGLLKPSSGKISIFGESPEHLGDYRHLLAYVPQILSIDLKFPISVEEAVIMGRYGRIGMLKRPSKHDKEIVIQMMEKVGIKDVAKRPISRLSGGQLQRVLLARALANEPEILFLDEPTSGVDASTTFNLYELLRELHKNNLTILMVSHDIGVVASFVDGVACLNRRLIVHGKPEEVLGGEELEQMYGCDAVFFHHGKIPHMVVDHR